MAKHWLSHRDGIVSVDDVGGIEFWDDDGAKLVFEQRYDKDSVARIWFSPQTRKYYQAVTLMSDANRLVREDTEITWQKAVIRLRQCGLGVDDVLALIPEFKRHFGRNQ